MFFAFNQMYKLSVFKFQKIVTFFCLYFPSKSSMSDVKKRMRRRFWSPTFKLVFIGRRFISRLNFFNVSPYCWKLPSSNLPTFGYSGLQAAILSLRYRIFVVGSLYLTEDKFWTPINTGVFCRKKEPKFFLLSCRHTYEHLKRILLFQREFSFCKSATEGLLMVFDISIIGWNFSRWVSHWSLWVFIKENSFSLRNSKLKVSIKLEENFFMFF